MGRRRTERVLCLAAALGSSVLPVACGQESGDGAILADSAYIQVVARLQLIPTPADTTRQPEADSARARVLADYGVTREQLIAFAEVAGRDPGRSRTLWEQIGSLVDSIRDADGLSPDTIGDDADGALSQKRQSTGVDTLATPGIRTDKPTADDPPRARRGRPVAGQPVRRP